MGVHYHSYHGIVFYDIRIMLGVRTLLELYQDVFALSQALVFCGLYKYYTILSV